MRTLFDVLLSWAVTLSGYPAPGVVPEVTPIPPGELHQKVCKGAPCSALAVLLPGEDRILVDERLDLEQDTEAQSLLVHEFVHFLQRRAGKMDEPDMSCEQRIGLEREAYIVQSRFAAEHGSGSQTAAMALELLPRVCAAPGVNAAGLPHAPVHSHSP
jgi:hypothetical protein